MFWWQEEVVGGGLSQKDDITEVGRVKVEGRPSTGRHGRGLEQRQLKGLSDLEKRQWRGRADLEQRHRWGLAGLEQRQGHRSARVCAACVAVCYAVERELVIR